MSAPITRVAEVKVFENRFGTLYNDDVVTEKGEAGRYLRFRWAKPGVIVVPVKDQAVGFCRVYRYPIGGVSLEVPRGGRSESEPVTEAAARELREEMGLAMKSCEELGGLYPETGLIETYSLVVAAEVENAEGNARPENMEAIAPQIEWLRPEEIWKAIAGGKITCAITLSALAMWFAREIVSR